jgi:hypothetical protein
VRITEIAARPMIGSPHVDRRLIVRMYIQVVLMIIGLLGAYVALAEFIA